MPALKDGENLIEGKSTRRLQARVVAEVGDEQRVERRAGDWSRLISEGNLLKLGPVCGIVLPKAVVNLLLADPEEMITFTCKGYGSPGFPVNMEHRVVVAGGALEAYLCIARNGRESEASPVHPVHCFKERSQLGIIERDAPREEPTRREQEKKSQDSGNPIAIHDRGCLALMAVSDGAHGSRHGIRGLVRWFLRTVRLRPALGADLPRVERLPKDNERLHLLETERRVRNTAEAIDLLSVRPELSIAVGPTPFLRGLHQGTADPTTSPVGLNIPAFHIGHGRARATLGDRPEAELEEPHERAVLLGDEDDQRRLGRESSSSLHIKLAQGLVGPEPGAELGPSRNIGNLERTDRH
jgi:hypothetical protein